MDVLKEGLQSVETSDERYANVEKSYNLSRDEYDLLLDTYPGCVICMKPWRKTPCVDHCHITWKVRGLLCSDCNTGLGHFLDSPEQIARYVVALQVDPELDSMAWRSFDSSVDVALRAINYLMNPPCEVLGIHTYAFHTVEKVDGEKVILRRVPTLSEQIYDVLRVFPMSSQDLKHEFEDVDSKSVSGALGNLSRLGRVTKSDNVYVSVPMSQWKR